MAEPSKRRENKRVHKAKDAIFLFSVFLSCEAFRAELSKLGIRRPFFFFFLGVRHEKYDFVFSPLYLGRDNSIVTPCIGDAPTERGENFSSNRDEPHVTDETSSGTVSASACLRG